MDKIEIFGSRETKVGKIIFAYADPAIVNTEEMQEFCDKNLIPGIWQINIYNKKEENVDYFIGSRNCTSQNFNRLDQY